MADKINLDIVTPEKVGVLPGHAAFVTTLEIGEVCIKKENRTHCLALSGGFAEVMNDRITILAEAAEMAEEIDTKRAEAAKVQAEEKLKDAAAEDRQFIEMEAALQRANNRIRVSARKT